MKRILCEQNNLKNVLVYKKIQKWNKQYQFKLTAIKDFFYLYSFLQKC